MKNKVFNLILVGIFACIFIFILAFTKGISNLVRELQDLSPYWLFTSIMCVLLFWFCEALAIFIITKTFYSIDKLFLRCVKYQMINEFFAAITPFGSGSQPAHLYAMVEDGIPAGISASTIMIKFIINHVANIFFLLLAFSLTFQYFSTKIQYFSYFFIFAFTLRIASIIVMLFCLLHGKLAFKLLKYLINLLYKIKIIKHSEAVYLKYEIEIKSFQKNFLLAKDHIGMCFLSFLCTALQWTAYFFVPYCIYRSFNLSTATPWQMFSGQIFLTNFISSIPLPGGEGGAEGGFYLLFGLFFHSGTVVTAIFIWRIITYYSALILCGSVTLYTSKLISKK